MRAASLFVRCLAVPAIWFSLCLFQTGVRAQTTCPTGQVLCGGNVCSNLSSDSQNCGACGHVCQAGQTCASGACVAQSCPAGQAICGGGSVCQSVQTDPQNCGACGHVCPTGQTCVSGACAAAGGSTAVFACKFTSGKLSGTTAVPSLSGPVNAPCSDNFGSSGSQVAVNFQCQFTQGPLAGQTLAPTGGAVLSGPAGQPCADNFGSSGVQVIPQ